MSTVDDRSDPVAALERLRTASSELLKHPNALPFPACVRQLNKFAEVLEAMNSTYSTMPDSQQGPQIEHQDSAPAPSTALTTLRDSCATLESEHCALHAAFFALRIAASDLNPSWDDVSALEKTIPEATATQILTNLAGLIPHLPPQRSEDTDEDSSAFMDGNGSDKHEPGSRYIDLKLRQMHAVPPSDEQGRLRAWLAAHWCAFEHLPVDSAGSRIALSVLAEVTLGIRKAAECGQIDDLSGTQNTSSYGRALLERLAVEVAEIKDEDGEVEEPTVDSLGELVDPDAELKATAPW
ncbi:hypothetical protein EJ06DRAFT_113883 [Trichodelitschia bisporula]|uniref:Uncharacterized protein n=1 Tax=Trichodelitschia bisporula TaxID=703511 RepID=A0A6G1HRJ6_9PEZI|nr:hypothetical protein EJ06DRAFT_113883 [Trichodelitschia bisporula]